MLIDTYSRFCANVDFSGGAATVLLGDVMDVGTDGAVGSNLDPLLVLQIGTAMAGGTSAQFHLVSDAQAAIAVDGTETRHLSTDAFAPAQLPAGTRLVFPIPQGLVFERYLGISVTRVGVLTAGTVTAFLTHTADRWRSYPEAVS